MSTSTGVTISRHGFYVVVASTSWLPSFGCDSYYVNVTEGRRSTISCWSTAGKHRTMDKITWSKDGFHLYDTCATQANKLDKPVVSNFSIFSMSRSFEGVFTCTFYYSIYSSIHMSHTLVVRVRMIPLESTSSVGMIIVASTMIVSPTSSSPFFSSIASSKGTETTAYTMAISPMSSGLSLPPHSTPSMLDALSTFSSVYSSHSSTPFDEVRSRPRPLYVPRSPGCPVPSTVTIDRVFCPSEVSSTPASPFTGRQIVVKNGEQVHLLSVVMFVVVAFSQVLFGLIVV